MGAPATNPPAASPAPSRALPQTGDEPALSPATPGATMAPSRGAAETTETPPLVPPATSRRTDRRIQPSTSGRVTFKSQVQPYVNDPDDLFLPPKADRPWRYIVLHHSAHATGSYNQIDQEHRKNLGTLGCGYHFVIGNGTDSPDGQIEVARRWSDQRGGAHCRNAKLPDVNDYGIGICLIGDLDHSPPTPKQIEAAHALVSYLRDRYQIPEDRIGTHAAIAQVSTACPGRNFPIEAILGKSGLAMR
jgi:hypothetical protein